nr:hypothetical protein [Tanacetum cinerariifolium]
MSKLSPKNAPALYAIRASKVQKVNKHKKSQTQMAASGQNHGKGENKQAYDPKPKIPPPPKREDPTKDSICHECGETGYWKRNCPQYLAELLKKKKNAALGAGGSGIFVILNIILNRSWIYDTGCGTHICNTTQGLRARRKLKSRALSLYVGNGQREAVEAIDAFHLCLSSGLEIVLNNCHYAPSLLEELFLFPNGTKMVLLTASHISKKRIEKLQHDGLLDSSDLRAFKKYVSCMSRKMERKPYTHQVERSKDLLRLIHTDVCGPFKIMSRQGASYFVTFTDDFSHYGYVYLLKHKHEDHGIIAHRTPPYTPQYNDVSKRRNRTLLDMVHKDTHALDHMCLYIDVEEHELRDLGKPANYKAALLNSESEKGLNAMNVEMQSMKDNEVWVLVELLPNGKTVGIDYEETYSPIADIRAIWILIAIATYYDYEIWQMDVKTAFLNGYLNEEVYMEQPKGFVNQKYPNWNSKRGSIPMQEKLKLSKSQDASTPVELKCMQNVSYASAVGSIMYAVRCNLLDVAFAQNVTGRFQQNLGDLHWTTVKNILMYLRNTKDMFLVYEDWICVRLNGGAIDWKSAKQSIFATSSAVAEYIADFDASKEAVWVRKFIYGLGVVPIIEEPISMYCDNTGAIAIANESGITKGARHFRAKVHYLREVIEYGDIKLEKVHTNDNLADPFTKALSFPKHSEHTRNIGMLSASSLIVDERLDQFVDQIFSRMNDMMNPRRREDRDGRRGEELEYSFFEGDGSSFDEWGDYGVADDDYKEAPDENNVSFSSVVLGVEEESMPDYDTVIEDVIDGEEDNMKDVVVVANDLCSLKIQTSVSVNFSKIIDLNPQELILLKRGNLVEALQHTQLLHYLPHFP